MFITLRATQWNRCRSDDDHAYLSLGEMITEEIKLVLRDRFPDTPDVRVELVWDPPWSPELMSEESRRQLGML